MAAFDHDVLHVELDEGIASIVLAAPGGVNKVDQALVEGLTSALDWIDGQEVRGILLTSAHRDFCVGADLEMLSGDIATADLYGVCTALNRVTRRLEQGPPAVALITGNALGGGYEIALACHHRLALDDARIQIGQPEVTLGVIPGGGGTQRLPRLIGIQAALDILLQGRLLQAPAAARSGLVDGLAPDPEALSHQAVAWITANPSAKQPWDERRFRWPGVRPDSPDARNLFLAASAMVYKKTAGAFEAPKVALSVVQEGAAIVFDRAMDLEARAFSRIATTPGARAMIRTLFFHKNAADKHRGLPRVESSGFEKVAILGAGMMGAGLAFVAAKAGFDVVLKDVRAESLERGMAHIDAGIAKLKHLGEPERQALRARITPALELEALHRVDLVIEAVFEDLALKHRVIREVEPLLADDAVFASNTSALPIGDLAEASAHPERFIGLHFFSPVEKMPLLEIITPEATSERTLARCLSFTRAIRKTPIVVNDGYGFYTTRVFSAYILEGAQLVAEGFDPVVVDWAARAAGMVVGPLQVFDEVTLTLGVHAMGEAEKYLGTPAIPGAGLVRRLVEAGRTGKAGGAGFYDYVNGRRTGIWPGLADFVGVERRESPVEALGERLLLAQVAEVGRALDAGVIRQRRDAEVGAVFGIGFAPNTGGPLTLVDTLGADTIVERLEALAAAHGERYAPSDTLRQMASSGERFF